VCFREIVHREGRRFVGRPFSDRVGYLNRVLEHIGDSCVYK